MQALGMVRISKTQNLVEISFFVKEGYKEMGSCPTSTIGNSDKEKQFFPRYKQ